MRRILNVNGASPRAGFNDGEGVPAPVPIVDGHRILLYTHDALPIRRQIGFAMQTSGTAPAFSDGVRKTITTHPPTPARKAASKAKPSRKGK